MSYRTFFLASVSVLASGAAALADCTTVNGTYSPPAGSPQGVQFQVQPGDMISVSGANNITGQISGGGINIFYAGSIVQVSSATATSAATVQVTYGRLIGAAPSSVSISCTPGAVTPPTTPTTPPTTPTTPPTTPTTPPTTPTTPPTTPTTPPTTPTTPPITPTTPGVTETEKLLIDTGSQASAGTQAGNVGQAIRNAYQLVQGPQVSQNGVFFSSRNDPSQVRDVDFWFSVSGSKFTGAADGNGYELSMGVQAAFSPNLTAGVALSYNNIELINTAGKLDIEGLVAGPYFNYSTGALTFNGYALYGETDYELNGASADGDRLLYGLTASTQIDRAHMAISPYVSVTGYSESIGALGAAPAKDVDQASLGLGARIDFTSVQNMDPYLVLGVDAWQFDDGTTTTSEVTPRIGAGVLMPVGNGSVAIDFSAAEVAKDLTQVNVGIRYNLKF